MSDEIVRLFPQFINDINLKILIYVDEANNRGQANYQ